MDEIKESQKKWEAFFSGKEYKPKTTKLGPRVVQNRSVTKRRMDSWDGTVAVSQPSAFGHLTPPFVISIGREIMTVLDKKVQSRTDAILEVHRETPVSHNRGTRVHIVAEDLNEDIDYNL